MIGLILDSVHYCAQAPGSNMVCFHGWALMVSVELDGDHWTAFIPPQLDEEKSKIEPGTVSEVCHIPAKDFLLIDKPVEKARAACQALPGTISAGPGCYRLSPSTSGINTGQVPCCLQCLGIDMNSDHGVQATRKV